jgi:integrase
MDNPAKKVRTPEVVTPEPGILTVEETEALFRANEKADPEICGMLALGAFAGIRASPISKIDYDEIDFNQRGIHTPAEKTKNVAASGLKVCPTIYGNGWSAHHPVLSI